MPEKKDKAEQEIVQVVKKEKKVEKKAKEAGITKEALKELEAKAKLADEYLDHLKRMKADFENYKKRQENQRAELIKFANSNVFLELLPVLDSFDRALTKVHASHDLQTFETGMELIHKQLADTLSRLGLLQMEAVGQPFDPTTHEAVLQVESEEYEEGLVAQELTKGYLLHKKVIRPAQVAVSLGRKKAQTQEKSDVQYPNCSSFYN